VTDQDDQLLETLARRNWQVLAAFLLLSLFWGSRTVSLGVLAGGLVAIGAFYWLHRSLVRLLGTPGQHSTGAFKSGYLFRLAALALILYLLVGPLGVHPVGLVAGLSVVIVNLLWTTIRRAI
jgi:hypothetical protein